LGRDILPNIAAGMIPLGTGQMTIGIGRRQFISALGGATFAWPLEARAQQPGKLLTIGFLSAVTPAVTSPWVAAFSRRLNELGWVEGHSVAIEYHWEVRDERVAEIVAEFVRSKVDVIATHGTTTTLAIKQATSAIPIVSAIMGDPVGTGLIKSLARPGGNVTGLSLQNTDLADKRVELLREVVPNLRRLAILGNVDSTAVVLEMREVEAASRNLGIEATPLEVRRAEEIAPAVESIKCSAGALYVLADTFANYNRVHINILAASARLPTIYNSREYIDAGGLMSYGPNFSDLFRRAAELVDKVLRGTKPADIPVEQPTKFDLVVDLTTARAIGLTIPESFLARADEVLQ
jgi:putative ABC transport system substrate-binding protein